MSKFFINRPIFAWVIAIILMVAGALAIRSLPIAQYPDIAPTAIALPARPASGYAEQNIATRPTAKQRITSMFDLPDTDLSQKSRLSSVLTQDRQVGRFGGFQGLPRVGRQGDGYQKLIAVIVAVCSYRL